jgi:hypothetical protein
MPNCHLVFTNTDGGNNGAAGGGKGRIGGSGGGNNGSSGPAFGAAGDSDEGVTAICVLLGLSLLAMLQRIPINADGLAAKGASGAWASITLCSN